MPINWFLGEPTTFARAFPEIETISVEVIETNWTSGWERQHTFSKSNIPSEVHCANPLCKQGGLDLQHFVNCMVRYTNKETKNEWNPHCRGHEGSPKGRRIGDPCGHRFKVKISIEYKKDEE